MKNMKRFFALGLSLMLVFSMAACNNTGKTDTKEDTSSDAQVTTTPATDATEAPAASIINFDEDPYVVAIENVTLGAEYPDTAAVEEAINAITLPAINCTVKIVNYHIADHGTKLSLAVAGGDKLDLVNTGLYMSLSSLVSDGIVMPLNDLLNERGKELAAKEGNLLTAATIDGQIYAVPANLYPSRAAGIGYNQKIADECGITVTEPVTLDQLTQIGAKIKATNPDYTLTTQGDGGLSSFGIFYNLEMFGGDLNNGVIMDRLNSTIIVNPYATEEYKSYAKLMKEWKELGYIPSDSLTNGQNAQDVYIAGNSFYQWTSITPNTAITYAQKGTDFSTSFAETTPNLLSTSSTLEFSWGITTSSERPDKVMDFLNFLYTNADVANLLSNGLEGKDYVKVSDNIINYPEGVNGGNVGYGRIFTYFGDSVQVFQFAPATESFYDDTKKFMAEAQTTKTFGYAFNATNVATEVAAVSSVITEYRPVVETGMADDVDATLSEFNTALKDAGIDKIIAENQAQLDAWLAQQ